MPSFPVGANLKGGRNAAPVNAQLAREFYEPIIPVVMELHSQGLSLRAIARELEQRGIKPRQEFPQWSAAQVRRILCRGLGKPIDVKPDRSEPVYVEPDEPAPPAPPESPYIQLMLNGKPKGLFTKSQVQEMLGTRKITFDTLYFFPGMSGWRRVRELFGDRPTTAKT